MEKFHGDIQKEADLRARWDALALGDLKGKRVLDVGAAEGWFSLKCQQAGAEIVAIEPVRPVFGSIHVWNVNFDAEHLPEEMLSRPFDIVLMLRVLYHMKIPQLALARAAHVLKPDGVLYLENWFDNPEDTSACLRYYADEPDGWRFTTTPRALDCMLHHYGFKTVDVIHSYQGGHRQIWRVTR